MAENATAIAVCVASLPRASLLFPRPGPKPRVLRAPPQTAIRRREATPAGRAGIGPAADGSLL